VTDGRERRVAPRHRPHGVHDILGRCVLEEEAARAGTQRLEGVLVEVEGGEDEDAGRRLGGDDAPSRLETVDARHTDVEDRHGRPEAPHEADRFCTVAALADDPHVRLAVEDHPQPGARERLVVDDEDVDRHADATTSGSVASTRNPPPGIGPAKKRPS
jgi:hypothetical protein